MRGYKYYGKKKHTILYTLLLIGFVGLLVVLYPKIGAAENVGYEPSQEWVFASSGIEYVKENERALFDFVGEELLAQIKVKTENPNHIIEMEDRVLYGYLDAGGRFVMNPSVSSDEVAYKESTVQLTCNLRNELSFTLDAEGDTPDDGVYTSALNIIVKSIGKSAGSVYNDLPKRQEILSYETTRSFSETYTGNPDLYLESGLPIPEPPLQEETPD